VDVETQSPIAGERSKQRPDCAVCCIDVVEMKFL